MCNVIVTWMHDRSQTEAEASVIWLQGPRFNPLFNRAALMSDNDELPGRVKSDDKSSMYCMHAKGSVCVRHSRRRPFSELRMRRRSRFIHRWSISERQLQRCVSARFHVSTQIMSSNR